jgi:transcriptional regulator with XRE-family HTH domain
LVTFCEQQVPNCEHRYITAILSTCQGFWNKSFTQWNKPEGIMFTTVNTLNTFSEWLLITLENKGWSQADLARAAKVSRSAISEIISGHRQVGRSTATSIASALKLPPEQVFRAAGILPPENEDPWADEMAHKLGQLSPGLRNVAERFINSMVEQEEAERSKNTKPKPRSAKA